MKQYNELEKKIADLQECEEKVNAEWAKIVKSLMDDNIHLDMDLQTTNRKLKSKTNELSDLKDSYEKLRQEFYLLTLEKLTIEQNYYSLKGVNMPIQHSEFISSDKYQKEKENYNKKIKEMNGIIKTLRDKLGNQTVPLTVIVDEIKKRAKMVGIESAYQLFESFNSVLSDVPAWKSNKSDLETFFIEERERTMKALNVNIEKGAIAQISEQPIINNSQDNHKLPK